MHREYPTVDPAIPRLRQAATVACVRDGDHGLEVVLLRRADSHVFCPSAHVFPGGAVDPADFELAQKTMSTAAGPAIDLDNTAHRIAATREAFEEAGLLVGLTAPARITPAALQNARDQLNAGRIRWQALCANLNLMFALENLIALWSYQTPPGQPRRYDTRFFLGEPVLPGEPACDGRETDNAGWWRPIDALSAADDSRIVLVRPTRRSLIELARYDSVAHIKAHWHNKHSIQP